MSRRPARRLGPLRWACSRKPRRSRPEASDAGAAVAEAAASGRSSTPVQRFALTPLAQLVVMATNTAEFKRLTGYKVSEGQTYAYPVIAGDWIYIKDEDGGNWGFESTRREVGRSTYRC